MNLSAHLIISDEIFAILATQPGPQGQITVTLDRVPKISPQGREMILIYRSGATREPMKMAAMPDGVKLRLRPVY
jgi:hypothetical protein